MTGNPPDAHPRLAPPRIGPDPYGQLLEARGNSAKSNPFRFSTKYADDETGLAYYGYRYFAPEEGRWVSRDPIEEADTDNLYAAVGNAPPVYVDALGLATCGGPDPWHLLLNYTIGGCGLSLTPEAINTAKSHWIVDSWRDNVRKDVQKAFGANVCGSSGTHSASKNWDEFFPFHINTGKWQLSVTIDCWWTCAEKEALSVDGKCCCSCGASCTEKGTISKTYTFKYTKDGNPLNTKPGIRLWYWLVWPSMAAVTQATILADPGRTRFMWMMSSVHC